MHENRETSETPAAQPGHRSAGEGLSHKARAYVCEESHSGILPMNHSNKDGTSPAESGEGRPLIKENAGQPNTYPTQSGKGVSQGLAGCRMRIGCIVDNPVINHSCCILNIGHPRCWCWCSCCVVTWSSS
jgi:hypothetical protein